MEKDQVPELTDGDTVTGRTYPGVDTDDPPRQVTGTLQLVPCPALGYVNHIVAGKVVDPRTVKLVRAQPTENANPAAVRAAMADYLRQKLEDRK